MQHVWALLVQLRSWYGSQLLEFWEHRLRQLYVEALFHMEDLPKVLCILLFILKGTAIKILYFSGNLHTAENYKLTSGFLFNMDMICAWWLWINTVYHRVSTLNVMRSSVTISKAKLVLQSCFAMHNHNYLFPDPTIHSGLLTINPSWHKTLMSTHNTYETNLTDPLKGSKGWSLVH